ncbi:MULTISPECIES: Na+/H+ antiporter subunit E [unclassified Variovorax]|uniref:Na+/H+ antiporter subunit E n=1 Tax=unclassified Variovorax TaxID=663243 RepID=UPI0013191183|nr:MULTISPECIES: Na+/H+ antiporter subunit E [unclassified Variovorax]VTU15556.1 Mrp complex subunit E1 [Variovorax sp. SRS16]VTU23508.1 Mrp complex subunit E1 [Variovorax sp. PBL-E5]
MKRWLPSPPLSLALFVVWVLLNQSLHPATLLLAAILALVVPVLTQGLRPATVRMRRPGVALRLAGVIAIDLVRSALTVARLLLTRRSADMAPRFVRVPLVLRDPNGLAVLAMILCLTPGTAWAEIAFDRSMLLIHVFDLDDVQAFIDMVKERYEGPLMEIFES